MTDCPSCAAAAANPHSGLYHADCLGCAARAVAQVGLERTATVLTHIDGKVQALPADDPRLAEREAQRVRLHHVANMRRLSVSMRRMYLDTVGEKEGLGARAMLEQAFIADWQAARA